MAYRRMAFLPSMFRRVRRGLFLPFCTHHQTDEETEGSPDCHEPLRSTNPERQESKCDQ